MANQGDGPVKSAERAFEVHSADSPISDPSDDVLGRNRFALALAADVRHAPLASGFVIGLTGPWGSGKTSVLRLLGHALQDDVCATVSFNPWLFSGTEQLVTHFFSELAGQLDETGSQKLDKVAVALSTYGRLVSPLRYVPYLGEIFRAASEAAQGIGKSLQARELSAEIQADNLKAELSELEKPILILVDDLDRLRPEEIVDVVRLVRLVGDFPNLIYVVAFDQEIVQSALNKNSGDGRAYLEKIIHISHALPPVRHEDLTRVLQLALSETIPNPTELRFDEQRLNSVFWSDTRPLFSTVRDVRRFANILRTTLELLGDEVGLADVLALEALRLFEPDAFDAMVAARYPLTGAMGPFDDRFAHLLRKGDDPAEEEQVKKVIEAARQSQYVERIVKHLFPGAEQHFGGSAYGGNVASEWKAARRVANGEVFDIYLHRRLAPGVLPTKQVEKILSLLGDESGLKQALDDLDDVTLRGLYTRLADYQGDIPTADVRVAMEVVMNRGVGFGDSFADMSGSMLVRRLLGAVAPDRIPELLRELTYPNRSRHFELLRAVSYREDRSAGMIPEDEASALEEEFRSEVLAADARELVSEPDFPPLIGLLAHHDRNRLVQRLSDWLSDDVFFVHFVAAHRFSKVAERNVRSIQLDWPSLNELLVESKCQDRLEQIDKSWVQANFDDETWFLWQQAIRYSDHPKDATEELAGWPVRRVGDEDEESGE